MAARVLIIEDNAANLELMNYLLKSFGYVPILAHNGEEGWEKLVREPPDFIICDVHLPGIDGFEITRRLRQNKALQKVPIIAVTALAMVGDRDKILSAGFNGYISKPIESEVFISQIETIIQEAG